MGKDYIKKLAVLGVFAIPFIALINIDSFAFPFVTGKAFIFRILIELLTGIWILLIIAERKYRPQFNWLIGSILAFFIIITVADIFGANPFKSLWGNFERMDGLIGLAHLFMYFVIAGTTLDIDKLWERLFNVTIGVSVLLSLIGLIQLAGSIDVNTIAGRLDSTFGNATYFAAYLLIHIFLAIFMFAKKSQKQPVMYLPKTRFLYIAIVILHIIVLYFTATRSAILGLFSGIFVTGVLIAMFAREQKRLRIIATGCIVAVFVIIFGFIAVRNQTFVKNNPILNRFNDISIQTLKNQERYYITIMAIKGVREHPVLGWGQENFNIVVNKYFQPALYNAELTFDRTHNVITEWLISGGLLGAIAYLTIYIVLLFYIWSQNNNPWSKIEKSILTGLVAAYFINNMFMFDTITTYIFFFTLSAYIYSNTRSQPTNEKPETRLIREKKRGIFEVIAIPTVVIVSVAMYYLNIHAISAAYYFKQAYYDQNTVLPKGMDDFKIALAQNSFGTEEIRRNMTIAVENLRYSPNFDPNTLKNFYTLAVNEMLKQVQETPNNALDYYRLGSLFYTYGDIDNTLTNLEQAHRLSPDRQMFLSKMVDMYIAIKDYKKAHELAKESFDLEPNNNQSRISYAITTILNGDQETGSKILTDRFGTDLIFDRNLMLAYEATNQMKKLVDVYEKRIKEQPDDIQSLAYLSICYIRLGQRNTAIKELEDARDRSPNNKDQIALWITQVKTGNYPQF